MLYAATLARRLMVRGVESKGDTVSLTKNYTVRYTGVERSQHVNQTDPRVYGQSYVANTSSVCGKSAFLGETAQHDHVDYVQSFARFCDNGLPSKLQAEEEAVIGRYPQLLELESKFQRLKEGEALRLISKLPGAKPARIEPASSEKRLQL